jgi:hypothetical protein
VSVLTYASVFALACVPGLPLGFALFGRRHAAGWIAGASMGYALTALAIWAPIFLGLPSLLTFAGAWLLGHRPLMDGSAWCRARDRRASALVVARYEGPDGGLGADARHRGAAVIAGR